MRRTLDAVADANSPQADTEGTGRLRAFDIQELVRQGDLGLTSVQLYALMSEVSEGVLTPRWRPERLRACVLAGCRRRCGACELRPLRDCREHDYCEDHPSADELGEGRARRGVPAECRVCDGVGHVARGARTMLCRYVGVSACMRDKLA